MTYVIRGINLILWIVAAALILPCVFVAGTLYPVWEKWGSNL